MDRCWERHGIKIYFGRWLVTAGMLVHEWRSVISYLGYPRAFLIDIDSSRGRVGDWKRDLFDRMIQSSSRLFISLFRSSLRWKSRRNWR
jgi:hypothetical protein